METLRMSIPVYIKFLELLEPKKDIPKPVDITDFMMSNFNIPAHIVENNSQTNSNEEAVLFLEKYKKAGFIDFEEGDLTKVREWFDNKNGTWHRFWFDTIQTKMTAIITEKGLNELKDYRVNNILKITNQSIVDTNKVIARNSNRQTWVLIGALLVSVISVTISWLNYKATISKSTVDTTHLRPLTIQRTQTTPQQPVSKKDSIVLKVKKK
jgi:hypothetical protein